MDWAPKRPAADGDTVWARVFGKRVYLSVLFAYCGEREYVLWEYALWEKRQRCSLEHLRVITNTVHTYRIEVLSLSLSTCSCTLRERGWPPPRPWPPGGRPDRGWARRARPTTGVGAGEDG